MLFNFVDYYEDLIRDCTNKEDVRQLINSMWEDYMLSDYEFDTIIYRCVTPKLEQLGCDLKENCYETIIKGDF